MAGVYPPCRLLCLWITLPRYPEEDIREEAARKQGIPYNGRRRSPPRRGGRGRFRGGGGRGRFSRGPDRFRRNSRGRPGWEHDDRGRRF